jgi:hypothetical protein
MRTLTALLLCVGFAAAADDEKKPAKKPVEPQIGHMVFFKLKSPSPENRAKLVEACKKYLADHEGIAYFSAGVIGDDFKRDVNDRDWDVALHLVFASKAAHDKYQDAPDHKTFIDENKDGWEKVRVFDSEVVPHKRKEGMKKLGEGDKKPDGAKPVEKNKKDGDK